MTVYAQNEEHSIQSNISVFFIFPKPTLLESESIVEMIVQVR